MNAALLYLSAQLGTTTQDKMAAMQQFIIFDTLPFSFLALFPCAFIVFQRLTAAPAQCDMIEAVIFIK